MSDEAILILILLIFAIVWGAWPIYGLIRQIARIADVLEAPRKLAERGR